MQAYDALARYSDRFTQDVPYESWADYIRQLFDRAGLAPRLVLDLACGTGTLTTLLSARGYEMIAVDSSPAMLAEAAAKPCEGIPPVYLCQSADRLDLYGTVDAAVCCLDSLNYITDRGMLLRALSRVHLFLEPGGAFIFDCNTPAHFTRIHGQTYVREAEDAFCVYQADYQVHSRLCTHCVELFVRGGDGRYARHTELHRERAYTQDALCALLAKAGFVQTECFAAFSTRPPAADEARVFYLARKAAQAPETQNPRP